MITSTVTVDPLKEKRVRADTIPEEPAPPQLIPPPPLPPEMQPLPQMCPNVPISSTSESSTLVVGSAPLSQSPLWIRSQVEVKICLKLHSLPLKGSRPRALQFGHFVRNNLNCSSETPSSPLSEQSLDEATVQSRMLRIFYFCFICLVAAEYNDRDLDMYFTPNDLAYYELSFDGPVQAIQDSCTEAAPMLDGPLDIPPPTIVEMCPSLRKNMSYLQIPPPLNYQHAQTPATDKDPSLRDG